jgi:hypothetical protein
MRKFKPNKKSYAFVSTTKKPYFKQHCQHAQVCHLAFPKQR